VEEVKERENPKSIENLASNPSVSNEVF